MWTSRCHPRGWHLQSVSPLLHRWHTSALTRTPPKVSLTTLVEQSQPTCRDSAEITSSPGKALCMANNTNAKNNAQHQPLDHPTPHHDNTNGKSRHTDCTARTHLPYQVQFPLADFLSVETNKQSIQPFRSRSTKSHKTSRLDALNRLSSLLTNDHFTLAKDKPLLPPKKRIKMAPLKLMCELQKAPLKLMCELQNHRSAYVSLYI